MSTILDNLDLSDEGSMDRSKAFNRLNEVYGAASDDNQRITVVYRKGKASRSFGAIKYESETRWRFL